jgi:hypothetical protein
VTYPEWLANVVMVKKKNGKWWMCTDFTDLNKCYRRMIFHSQEYIKLSILPQPAR